MDEAQRNLAAAVADALPVGIWVARAPSGELLYANPAFGRIMGMEARDDIAAGGYSAPYGIFDREGRPYAEERLPFVRAIKERRTVVVDDLSIHRPDGTRIAVRAFAQPMFEADGSVSAVAIAFFDVTAEAEAVRDRLAAQARLGEVVNEAPVILYAFDAQGRITLSEGKGLDSIGLEPGQTVGLSVYDICGDNPEAVDVIGRVLKGEEAREIFAFGPYLIESSLRPLRTPEGEVAGAIGVGVNVTEREGMRSQLREADRMALLGTITASVAHEVNTPLAYIEASLEHLAREMQEGPEAKLLPRLRRLLDEARLGTMRVKTIARDLSTFSKPQERIAPVDLHEVIESALRMSSHETTRKARLVRRFQEVPPVAANEAKLAQVFLNLLINASQAISEGAPETNEICVSSARDGEWAVVEVSDSGEGIRPENLSRIFEPRFTTKPMREGTGLGLTICRKIVAALGGEISAESRPGHTQFRVRLPLIRELPAGSPPPPALLWTGRPRVLVIDDDKALLRVLQTTLDDLCELDLADGGATGAEKLIGGPTPDVVLCDLMMGGFSGMDVFEEVRKARPGLEQHITFMTGGAFTREARHFLDTIPNRCFEKPFNFEEAIGEVLRTRKASG